MSASFYANFTNIHLVFSFDSVDAGVFVGVGLADVGASHFRLDAVQVQGAVLTSTHCCRVDGHLLVAVWRQYALLLHDGPQSHCPRRWKYHRRLCDLLPPGPLFAVRVWNVVLDGLHSGHIHSICGGVLWQLHHRRQNLRLETSSRRRRQRRQGQPQGRTLLSCLFLLHRRLGVW